MFNSHRVIVAFPFFMVAFALFLCLGSRTEPPRHSSQLKASTEKAAAVIHASGTFDVKLDPLPQEEKVGDPTIGRFSIDKEIHGDIEGTTKGQMLAVTSDVKGSAGYVAMERVTGKLRGKSGTFALQRSGTMAHGSQQLTITVVPDSGTGELVGITGKFMLTIADGKHSYDFEYTLPESK